MYLTTLASEDQQARVVRGSRRPSPPRKRAHDSIPCATRDDVPLPASITWRKRKVSFSSHPMHCDMPGASPWAFMHATKGASGGHTASQVSGRSDSDAVPETQSHSPSPFEAGGGGSSSQLDARGPHMARCCFNRNPGRKALPQVGHRTSWEATDAQQRRT
jgi:hypothetical protein